MPVSERCAIVSENNNEVQIFSNICGVLTSFKNNECLSPCHITSKSIALSNFILKIIYFNSFY